MNDLKRRLEQLSVQISDLVSHLNLPQKEQRLLELQDRMQAPDFWQDNEQAQKTSQEYNQLKIFYDFWAGLEKSVNELAELVKSNTDESAETLSYLEKQVAGLEEKYKKNRFIALLSKKYDDHNAIFSIHAGAGGLDAQDWAEMLLRMFLRYCEKKGFTTDIIESSKGADGGIKSATVEVHGPYAYGLLKSEAGVHRLVRLSPYNPAHTRETSFALLELIPILEAAEEISIDPKDLKIEVTTSSGHGGQSVNTTYSAVRMTHIPSGIKVSIQNERSQHQNREIALKILTAKLKALEEARVDAEKKQLRGEFKSAEWGNQIRSYVLHPYQMVKDHRTNYETSDTDSVLNGNLDGFVEAYLEKGI
jgi:peptide chain release factor 2